jgi:hypothetical protein
MSPWVRLQPDIADGMKRVGMARVGLQIDPLRARSAVAAPTRGL